MKQTRAFILLFTLLLCRSLSYAQDSTQTLIIDSAVLLKANITGDTVKKHSPRKAIIRSAILPGWGQAYNKKYWKIPIIYGALGATGYVFADNIKVYRDVRYAYQVSVEGDTSKYESVAEYLKPFVRGNYTNSLRNFRNESRRNIDYSVLVFLLFWGLNVVDATVDAHLKDFDVSPNLSMKIKPMLPTNMSQNGNTPGSLTGLSLVLDIHKARPRLLPISP